MNRESSSLLRLRRRVFPAVFAAAVFFLLVIIGIYKEHGSLELSSRNKTALLHHRKLLNQAAIVPVPAVPFVEPNRIWTDKCSKSDVVISQGATEPLPSGTPTYTVEIMNICPSGCNIAAVHVSCGWFSSARLVNPRVFKRLRFDDCLVNDGKPLVNGRTVSFQYANTYPFHLSVTSVNC